MKLKALVLFVCTFALPLVVLGQSVDGKWVEIGEQGSTGATLTLRAEGSTLTGTWKGTGGFEAPLSEGTFANNALKFKVRGPQGGIWNWSGTFKGDAIAMLRTPEGRPERAQTVTLKRQQ